METTGIWKDIRVIYTKIGFSEVDIELNVEVTHGDSYKEGIEK